ncbi:MAG: DUF4397 domain-containing protein [Sediminibacterium sp.]|nr:DUF4397 domain-containing protein [Sediminibacterium sp.]
MKKIVYYFIAFIAVSLSACNKDAITLNTDASASFAVLYASPGGPTVDILVDGILSNGSRRLTYGTTSAGGGSGNGGTYIPITTGSRNIKISPDSGKTNLVDATNQFDANKPYTFAVYDVLPSPKFVLIPDDLTLPTGTNTHVRFLHLAPGGPTVDVTFTKGTADSVTLTGKSYIGASPNATSLAPFTPIPGASSGYTIKIKQAGTQTVLLAVSAGSNFTAGRIVTIAAIGTAASQPLSAMVLRHY